MKWSKQLYSVLIISLIFILTSVNSTSSIITSFENTSDQTLLVNSITEVEGFVQSSVNETMVYGPSQPPYECWGWAGNLSFTYWDVTEDIGIPGATVSCSLWITSPDYFDLGNGTYLVEINTTYLWVEIMYFYLFVNFAKTGFEDQAFVLPIVVFPLHTHLEVFVPDENRISENPYHLMVPLGDSIDILFNYNDTSNSQGIEDAQTSATIIGPTLVQHQMEIVDIGDGLYIMTFNTTEEWMYTAVGGAPLSQEQPYLLDIQFSLENRTSQFLEISISIIDIPTELEITPSNEQISIYPGSFSIFVYLVDLWPSHGNALVQDVNITVDTYNTTNVEVASINEDPDHPGLYEIILLHNVPASVQATIPGGGCMPTEVVYASIILSIIIEKEGYETKATSIFVDLIAYGSGGWPPPANGFPISLLVVLIIGVLYFRHKRRLQVSVSTTEIVSDTS